jgi:uncharacterized protein YjdB
MNKNILTILTLLIIGVNSVKAATIEVQNTNDSSVGSLRQSILDANDGDTIRFNPTLIASGSNTISLSSEVAFSKVLVFKGLYDSSDTLYISGSNTNRIFNITNTVKSVIDSMVFINGTPPGSGVGLNVVAGGALSIEGVDTVYLSNSTISNCATQYGGGLAFRTNLNNAGIASQIFLEINNSIIENNSAINDGGGVLISGSNITMNITNSTINNNTATVDAGGISAFAFYTGTVTIDNSNITNNSALNGGGLKVQSYYTDFYTTLTNTTVDNNTASTAGGGIYSIPAGINSVVLNKSTLSNNTANNAGGIRTGTTNGNECNLTLSHSTISGNHATDDFGGIACFGQAVNFIATNSTISDNSTAISWNKCGGVFVLGSAFGTISSFLEFTNCIVSTSVGSNIKHQIVDGGGSIILSTDPITSGGYNIFSDAPIGANATGDLTFVSDVDLDLQPLANNGGTTLTMQPGATSVAIDAGNPTDVSDAQNLPISGIRDIGAAEYINNITLVSSVTVQGQGGVSSINTQAGTLQMEATVLPANADDLTYTWSVSNQSGSASIDINGMLTGLTDGTVMVIATANDASGETGTTQITISNQNPIILVNSITVQGQGGVFAITTQGGTLQMEAAVLPANADDDTYTWSVMNGTGTANIDLNGVLTAVSDGTVEVTATANDASGETGTTTISISNQSLNVNDNGVLSHLLIYPNPVQNELFIELNELEITKISISNYSGELVKSITNNTTKQIDVSDLKQGVYFLRVSTENGVSTNRFIKQ